MSNNDLTFDRYVAPYEGDDREKIRKMLQQDTNAPLHYWIDILRYQGFEIRPKDAPDT